MDRFVYSELSAIAGVVVLVDIGQGELKLDVAGPGDIQVEKHSFVLIHGEEVVSAGFRGQFLVVRVRGFED